MFKVQEGSVRSKSSVLISGHLMLQFDGDGSANCHFGVFTAIANISFELIP